MFNTGLTNIDDRTTGTKNVFVGRTHMLPGILATGSVMLGYNSTFYVWGVNSWNTSLAGESYQTGNGLDSPAYALLTAVANDENSTVDVNAPGHNRGSLGRHDNDHLGHHLEDGKRAGHDEGRVWHLTGRLYDHGERHRPQRRQVGQSDRPDPEHTVLCQGDVIRRPGQRHRLERVLRSRLRRLRMSTPPTITNVSPADGATVFTTSPTMSADLFDAGSGINTDPASR